MKKNNSCAYHFEDRTRFEDGYKPGEANTRRKTKQVQGMSSFGRVEDGLPVVSFEVDPEGFGVLKIQRERHKNAVHDHVYEMLTEYLLQAEKDLACKVVVITGAGKYFCSGADLAQGFDCMDGPLKSMHGSYHDAVGRFMSTVIRFPKPLVAAVNGPAIGVGCTILPHCDVVFASERSYFWTPFTKLSVCPEFCSSVTFPAALGKSLANEVLLFGKRLSPQEAKACGFLSDIIPADQDIVSVVKERLGSALAEPNSGRSFVLFKALSRDAATVEHLLAVHRREMELLDERRPERKNTSRM